jgi:hypothetical protein
MNDQDVIEHILTQLETNAHVSYYKLAAFEGWLENRLPVLLEDGYKKALLFILDTMMTSDFDQYHIQRFREWIDPKPTLFNRYEEYGYSENNSVMIDGVLIHLD